MTEHTLSAAVKKLFSISGQRLHDAALRHAHEWHGTADASRVLVAMEDLLTKARSYAYLNKLLGFFGCVCALGAIGGPLWEYLGADDIPTGALSAMATLGGTLLYLGGMDKMRQNVVEDHMRALLFDGAGELRRAHTAIARLDHGLPMELKRAPDAPPEGAEVAEHD